MRSKTTLPPMNPLELASFGPVIPVIVLQRVEDAVPLARALVAGGVRVLEVTLRTPVALECMAAIVRDVPEAIVGAGTIRSVADAEAAKDAGCRFGVSPGYLSDIGHACRNLGLPLLPGVATASEVMSANAAGYDFLKFFPATASEVMSANAAGYDFLKFFPATAIGGMPLLKALAGPFPDVMFCPTGGVTPETAPQFLALPNVKVCGGSWLTPQDAVDAGDWGRITALAQAASALRG